ncbi:hypothetical protein C8Q80DRAFT_543533 [Daedaleopsis nitida]|nr:hypothetical protein C8Q80DRAFT_543533 [Daedaleopsis nitida]
MSGQSVYSEPPPSYRSYYTSPYDAAASETASLLPKSKPLPRRLNVGRCILAALGCLLFIIWILQNVSLVPCLLDDIPAPEKRALRRQWKVERAAHEAFTRQWDSERALFEKEQLGWEQQRSEWREEERKWEEERRNEERHRREVERRRQGVYWTEPVGDQHCAGYAMRVYRARLMDIPPDLNWLEVCSDMPVTIHGRSIDKPDDCKRDDHGWVWGNWFVSFDEPSCVPYWDNIHNKGCAPGHSGMKRIEARLWGIQHGDNWEKMCATTPATIDGQLFDHPMTCDNRGSISGMVGIWDVPDSRWC